MSTPSRRARGQVYADASGWTWEGPEAPCCDSQWPVPVYVFVAANTFPGGVTAHDARHTSWRFTAKPQAERAKMIAQGIDPDELWCWSCQTTLEQLRDALIDGGPAFLKLIAAVAAYVPGIGSGVAWALGAAAALAAGESIDQAMLDATMAAVPGGVAMQTAVASGVRLAQGEGIDDVLLAAGREAIKRVAGPVGAAAYDGITAVAQGKALQDAGFAMLYAFARGSELVEKTLHFTEAMGEAVAQGVAVRTILVRDLIGDLRSTTRYERSVVLGSVVDQIVTGGEAMLRQTPAELANALGVAEVLVRAAQAAVKVLADGTLVADQDLLRAIQPPIDLTSAAALILASTSVTAALAEQRHELLLGQLQEPVLLADPNALSSRLSALASGVAARDPKALEAAAAVERGKRILARQPWIEFYNRVSV